MTLLTNCISISDLAEVKGKTKNTFYSNANKRPYINNLGSFAYMNKDNLAVEDKPYGLKCIDLSSYIPFVSLCKELGLSDSYLFVNERLGKKYDCIKLSSNRARLFKLSDEFIKLVKQNKVPFAITKQNKEDEKLAETIILMQGIKIGFY